MSDEEADEFVYTEEPTRGPFCICGKRAEIEAEVERLRGALDATGAIHLQQIAAIRRQWEDEVVRLREAINAHRSATKYNPRAAWVNACLWAVVDEPEEN